MTNDQAGLSEEEVENIAFEHFEGGMQFGMHVDVFKKCARAAAKAALAHESEVRAAGGAEAVAYAIFMEGGQIRLWGTDRAAAEKWAAERGRPLVPLYAAPAEARAIANAITDSQQPIDPKLGEILLERQSDLYEPAEARGGQEAVGDEAVAVRFYRDNPSAALLDFRQRIAAPSAQAGFRVVPVEPTQAMIHAGIAAAGANTMDVWRAMLAAAPAAPAQPTNWPAVESIVEQYVSDYEMEGDSGGHVPSADERALIADAIHGLLAEPGFVAALAVTAPAQAGWEDLYDDLRDAVIPVYNALRSDTSGVSEADIARLTEALRHTTPRDSGERTPFTDRPEMTGVGAWCAPGPAAEQQRLFILRFEDQDRREAHYTDEGEARRAFARAEALGWNCHLLAHLPRDSGERGEKEADRG